MEARNYKPKGLISYFSYVAKRRTEAEENCFNYDIALKHLERYTGSSEVPFNAITIEWFEGLKNYFIEAKGLRCEKKLSHNSANSYFSIITAVAREAANDGYIEHKIVNAIFNSGPRKHVNATLLSFDEVQRLANTPCKPSDLKKAFLFSCLTGLQWKEIKSIKWRHLIVNEENEWKVVLDSDNEQIDIPVSMQARQLLGVGEHPDRHIFNVHYSAAMCVSLNRWALRAGITRNITFQSARQTFGQMLLDEGVELELISELLGHKHLKTTAKFLSVNIADPIITSNYLRTFNV